MATKLYEYKSCSTCQKARKWLDKNKISYESIPIVEVPPGQSDLKLMLKYLRLQGGDLKNLFNTSGIVYRELRISDKLKDGLTETEALKLLSENGKLVKRPFILTDNSGAVGFKEDTWSSLFNL